MSPEDALPAIAEMSITIAGFTGLIISIRPQAAAKWGKDEVGRVIGIVSSCLIVALCSILPYALTGMGASKGVTWAIPLVITGSFSIAHVSLLIRANLRGEFFFIMKPVTYPLFTIAAISAVFCILSASGIFLPYSSGLLVFHLTWVLFVSSVSLAASIAVIFARHKDEFEEPSSVTRRTP